MYSEGHKALKVCKKKCSIPSSLENIFDGFDKTDENPRRAVKSRG